MGAMNSVSSKTKVIKKEEVMTEVRFKTFEIWSFLGQNV